MVIDARVSRPRQVQPPLGPLFHCRCAKTHCTLRDSRATLRAEKIVRLQRGSAFRARVLEPQTAFPAETVSGSTRHAARWAGGFAVHGRLRFRGAVLTEDARRTSPSVRSPAGGHLPALRTGSVSRLARLDDEQIGACRTRP